jgi:hypothetical protein
VPLPSSNDHQCISNNIWPCSIFRALSCYPDHFWC